MSEKRECPNCKAEHEYEPLIANGKWETTCSCGTKLRLEWERTETDDGPEDGYWFEIINPPNAVREPSRTHDTQQPET